MNFNITVGTADEKYLLCISTITVILSLIATIKLFRKAGREGWEVIIPIYNSYTEYKLFWTTKMFWISLALKTCTILCLATIPLVQEPIFRVTAVLGLIGVIAWIVLKVMRIQKIAHAFNRRGMFTVGLFFFTTIFSMIMAFGKDEYVGANL